MREREVLATRQRRIGYVFQSFGLAPVLSAAENVDVPLRLRRVVPAERALVAEPEVLRLAGG